MPRGVYKRTKEHGRKISKAKMGHIVSEATRKKISESFVFTEARQKHFKKLQGVSANARRGKPLSKEHKRKISGNTIKAMKSVPREKLAYWKGKSHSEEYKRRMSKTKKGYAQTKEGKEQLKKLLEIRVSQPQFELFYILKMYFHDAQLVYLIKTKKGIRFADIGIPSLKLDIEFDGVYWHEDRKESDYERDLELAEVGWMTLRINSKLLEKLSKQGIKILNGMKIICPNQK